MHEVILEIEGRRVVLWADDETADWLVEGILTRGKKADRVNRAVELLSKEGADEDALQEAIEPCFSIDCRIRSVGLSKKAAA